MTTTPEAPFQPLPVFGPPSVVRDWLVSPFPPI